jgi:negative regulator of replication initiation
VKEENRTMIEQIVIAGGTLALALSATLHGSAVSADPAPIAGYAAMTSRGVNTIVQRESGRAVPSALKADEFADRSSVMQDFMIVAVCCTPVEPEAAAPTASATLEV